MGEHEFDDLLGDTTATEHILEIDTGMDDLLI